MKPTVVFNRLQENFISHAMRTSLLPYISQSCWSRYRLLYSNNRIGEDKAWQWQQNNTKRSALHECIGAFTEISSQIKFKILGIIWLLNKNFYAKTATRFLTPRRWCSSHVSTSFGIVEKFPKWYRRRSLTKVWSVVWFHLHAFLPIMILSHRHDDSDT